jgi:hypothetical protein
MLLRSLLLLEEHELVAVGIAENELALTGVSNFGLALGAQAFSARSSPAFSASRSEWRRGRARTGPLAPSTVQAVHLRSEAAEALIPSWAARAGGMSQPPPACP